MSSEVCALKNSCHMAIGAAVPYCFRFHLQYIEAVMREMQLSAAAGKDLDKVSITANIINTIIE